MRATFDTNVFVSALNFGGIPETLLSFETDGAFTLCISEAIVHEPQRILAERFHWPADQITAVLEPMLSRVIHVSPGEVVLASRDPDDDHILACALESDSDCIVTGDKDLLQMGSYAGIPVLTPRQFLDYLIAEGASYTGD